jgi:hypothetical protein
MGTIFPFWVSSNNSSNSTNPSNPITSSNPELVTRNSKSEFGCSELVTRNPKPATGLKNGFVELPYTLPQDFTLFVLMKERNIDIWKKKLDWIAEKGGMALLITHPDYMNGKKGKCGIEEYPMKFYEELLAYIKSKYDGQYWHVLPKEMAHFWKQKMVAPASF